MFFVQLELALFNDQTTIKDHKFLILISAKYEGGVYTWLPKTNGAGNDPAPFAI
jgi:hypothetical protein